MSENRKLTPDPATALLNLARKLDEESCVEFPVKWVADEIRLIVIGHK